MNILPRDLSGSGKTILKIWNRLSGLPGGRLLFSKLLARINPYTGTIDAKVLELGPGYARAQMRERRRIQNHVSSIHAIALINLAEVSSGLALMCGLPEGARGIPVELSIQYHKKARGLITATCRCEPPATSDPRKVEVPCEIRNAEGVLVASAQARWQVGPKVG